MRNLFESVQTLENIVPDVEMPTFQNIGVQSALLNKKMLLAFDTGTGKTFTYSVFVRGLLNRNPEKKHIFIIIHDSIKQAPADIAGIVAAPVLAFSSVAGEAVRLAKNWNRLSIAVLTYECFRQEDFVEFIYAHLDEIESVVIDEAHHISNWDTSDTAFMIRSLCHFIPYVVELSATPMTSHRQQYFQLMNVIDRSLSSRRDETPSGKYDERYMAVNRGDYEIKGNYKTTLKVVTPQKNQIGHIHGIVSRVVKGTGAINQVEELIRVVKERLRDDKQIIIYVNYHDTRAWVEQYLTANGIEFISLHGKVTKMDEREKLLALYKNREVNVLITSVAESLNIDSDVVVFYEFTTKLKQVMGRAHRGLSEKELELVFIVTKDTDEVEYFLKYIYNRSLTIQKLLHKDYSEFIKIGEQVKLMSITDD